jgi:hypothetical protein
MTNPRVYLYAEFQVSIPFKEIDWKPIDVEMKKYAGLISKTWLSGINNQTVGGFYAFDSEENAQKYISGLHLPFGEKIGGNLSTKLFDADATREASVAIHSPFFGS